MEYNTSRRCNSCKSCNKRILDRKSHICCCICMRKYHPICANLTPSDINLLKTTGLYNTWSCYSCNIEIFPRVLLDTTSTDSKNSKHTTTKSHTIREFCNTCSKIGNKLESCELCGLKSHIRCFAGTLGCKCCLRNIYPGYDVNVNELFRVTCSNNVRFNPFNTDSDVNNIGFTDLFDNHTEDWSTYSELLDNCKYFEPSGVKSRLSGELKVFSLNIRSLKDKITTLNDDIDNFSKYDLLCFNETNTSPDKLPFEGKELELKKFHPPIIQAPARSSNRGGGLAIYVNKELCSVSDYKILTNVSQNSDPAKGEFLFIEISRNNNKNIIIGNMYRSPSGDPSTFICELESKLENLKRHNKKHIILVSDSNIDQGC